MYLIWWKEFGKLSKPSGTRIEHTANTFLSYISKNGHGIKLVT